MVDKPSPTLYLSERVFYLQLAICSVIGLLLFLLFCFLRRRWPHIYAVRVLRNDGDHRPLPKLPPTLFGWVSKVLRITDEEVLGCLGLDAYVFLTYFRMAIAIFATIGVFAVAVLGPLRYYYGGLDMVEDPEHKKGHNSQLLPWLSKLVYPVATYLFSGIVYFYLYHYTQRVLRTRQKYLASQDSITDRTIRIDNVPLRFLRSPTTLTKFIGDLGIGKVTDVKFIYDWTPMERLFDRRKEYLRKLEDSYATHYELGIDIYNTRTPMVVPKVLIDPGLVNHVDRKDEFHQEIRLLASELDHVNAQIRDIQHNGYNLQTLMMVGNVPPFRQIRLAFVTMDLVALAQMAAQTVLDPRVYTLLVNLAPAPMDILWGNYRYLWKERIVRGYLVTFVIVLSYLVISFLASQLAVLLSETKIDKQWPWLGRILDDHDWLKLVVTGILPPFLFLMLNLLMLYFYRYLTQKQGYLLNLDVELSTLLKNFFYVFFIWFLVFVASNTITDYLNYIKDTTKIAQELAKSLRGFAGFYVNLILLQGLAQFPVKLLQIGDFVILNVLARLFLFKDYLLKTPRDYRAYYYTPQVFDFGINMPQHLFIFIVILIYLVVSTKIVTLGLLYFGLGYLVYKYQLIYNFVHPPHSTGKVWVMIFRRIVLALVIFQLFMCGTLALSNAYWALVVCVPLVFGSLFVLWNFERYYTPLVDFIALRAILLPFDYDSQFASDDEERPLDVCLELEDNEEAIESTSRAPLVAPPRRRRLTIEEEREQNTDYTYPRLVDPLDGPWVGFEGDYISMVEYHLPLAGELDDPDLLIILTTESEMIIKKRLRVPEWE